MKAIEKDKEGQYLMIKGSSQEEDIAIVNMYAPNIGAPKYIQQILRDIKGKVLKHKKRKTSNQQKKGRKEKRNQPGIKV